MATSGTVAIRFIIAHTHSARLIPILTTHMTSKSKDIRRAMCEFLDQLLHTWPTHILEKHVALIQSAVANGIKDADPDARAYSRKYDLPKLNNIQCLFLIVINRLFFN